MVFACSALYRFQRTCSFRKVALLATLFCSFCAQALVAGAPDGLSNLKRGQAIADFRLAHLYDDPDGKIVGLKLWHVPSGAPVFLLRIETVPQAFLWVDTPDESNKGLPHSLEHLLESKGTKGRYLKLLVDMRLSRSAAATDEDFNHYGFASGSGLDGFFELFHAFLDALYHPDFTDAEAEQEFYHFGVVADPVTKRRSLVEQGSVYDEMLTGQGSFNYYFELNQRVLGRQNPFSFYSAGVPDEMRGVTPQQIRDFHAKHYRLGPTTGFIFALDPQESVAAFLGRVSEEFKSVPMKQGGLPDENARQPKYPIAPDPTHQIVISPFPGANESDPGEVRFSWRAMQVDSRTELRLLQLFFRALAEGERSLLYKSLIDSKTRELDSGATAVESEPFLSNSPHFPVWNVGLSGIPGNRISLQRVSDFRDLICKKIREISEDPDDSPALHAFDELVTSYSLAWRRVEKVWAKNAPDFGVRGAGFTWKEYLNVLEMDPSFRRSISEESLWQEVDRHIRSGKNIWRDLILKFHLLDPPYATASLPSAKLMERLEDQSRNRIHAKVQSMMAQYHTEDEQQALTQFESGERAKTKEIAEIEAKVPRPHFTDHPPLTWDDSIRYRQFALAGTPVVATLFQRPPTINLGLAFDLKRVPKEYYKYLPILARCFDSLGVREGKTVTSYPELLAQIRTSIYDLWVSYEFDALARRGNLAFRVSGTSVTEFRRGLELLHKIMWSNYLDIANADRLRDIIDQRLSSDDSFTKQGEEYWIPNPAYSFLHQDDPLFFALNSQFTWAHWDWRLKWRLHKPVDSSEIDALGDFSNRVLASGVSDSQQEFVERLRETNASGLQRELVDYWSKNLAAFPDSERTEVLRQLASEVQQDLRAGPAQTIEELKRLEAIVLDRRNLHVDLTVSPEILREVQPELTGLIQSIPTRPVVVPTSSIDNEHFENSVLANLSKRYNIAAKEFPVYVALVHPEGVTGDVIFYSHASGYTQIDRESIVRGLAKNLFSGVGPQSFHMKVSETGLAYSSSLTNDPSEEYTWYYADRIPDIPALIGTVNAHAATIPTLTDPFLVDYALRQSFRIPRSMITFSQRGWAMAQDIWNGNTPEKIRRFSQSVLAVRHDPHLLSELTAAGFDAVCGVLLDERCKQQQQLARSIFFFIGSEKVLSDTEGRLPHAKLMRLWRSDYWLP